MVYCWVCHVLPIWQKTNVMHRATWLPAGKWQTESYVEKENGNCDGRCMLLTPMSSARVENWSNRNVTINKTAEKKQTDHWSSTIASLWLQKAKKSRIPSTTSTTAQSDWCGWGSNKGDITEAQSNPPVIACHNVSIPAGENFRMAAEWRPNAWQSVLGTSPCSASTYGPEVVPQRLETGICAFHRHSIRIASINQVNCHQIYPWHQRISKCDWFVSSHFRCSCASSSRHRAMLDLLWKHLAWKIYSDAARHHSNKHEPQFSWRRCTYIYIYLYIIYYMLYYISI